MKASTIIVGAVLLLLLILVVYAVEKDPQWVQKSYWMAHYIEKPWRVYRRSDGTFDDAAALALQRAMSRANPAPEDNALCATVIARNILAQEEHRPARGPTGALTRAAVARARFRRGMYDEARNRYMAALAGLAAGAAPARPASRRATRGGAAGNVADAAGNVAGGAANAYANPGFIIDAAIGFAFGGLDALLDNDPVVIEVGWGFDNITQVQGALVDQPLAAAAESRREGLARERQAAARAASAAQGGARRAGVAAYVELATQNTDDPQNTHDPGVLACLRAIVERLRADQAGAALPGPDEVLADIRARGAELSEGRAHRLADVEAVIARTRAGERVVAVGATDAECLGRVWLRADDPRNAPNRDQLRQAVFDALYDCWEEGIAGRKIVCVNGRTSRILSALILLDWDEKNWEVKRLEQFKNEIFARAAEVIAAEAERAVQSDDADMRQAGRAHLARTAAEMAAAGEAPEAAQARLADQMRAAIGAMVDAHVRELEETLGVRGAIPPYMVAAVTKDAQAAVV